MISIIRIFLFISLLACTACVKNEFKFDFDLDPSVNGNYTINYYAAGKKGGLYIETTAVINGGKALMKGATRNPTLAFIHDRGDQLPTVVYVKRGETIKIAGADRDPATWNISGNEINEKLTAWRHQYADTLSKGKPEMINAAVEKFVKEHTADPVSVILMMTYFSREEHERQYATLWNSLSDNIKSPEWIGLVSRSDQQDPYAPLPAKLISMAMRGMNGKVDTLRTKNYPATLALFWSSADNDKKTYVDSLRTLSKLFPDSAGRLITDICLDSDSVGWKAKLPKDSLKNVARLWTPAGLADENVMKLGVRRTPYLMVFNREGRQIYRGSDWSEAAKEFRKLMKKQ